MEPIDVTHAEVYEHFMITGDLVILHDYNFWGPIQDEFDEWSKENRCKRIGTIVEFEEKDALLMFLMRWA